MSPLLSFDRPLDPLSPGTLDEQWDLNFHAWLEEELPEIDYASDVDLHLEADLLDGYDLVILSGHHEYWTARMRAAIDAHVGNGGNVFVAASNVAHWQIRIQDGGRRFRCHKKPWQDPAFSKPSTRRQTTSRFATAPVLHPPESTFGIAFRHANCAGSGPGEECSRPPIEGTPASYGYVEGFASAGGLVGKNRDRVVLWWEAVGKQPTAGWPGNMGRTGTLEVGHYLGLYHTFCGGCGSAQNCYGTGDLICDTNGQQSSTWGCPGSPSSCGSATSAHAGTCSCIEWIDSFIS